MAEEARRGPGEPGPCLVVVNPASANGTTRRSWPALSEKLKRSGVDHAVRLTGAPGDASVIVRRALREEGFRTIIVVGGDGTVNEVINGFFDGETWLGEGTRLGLVSRGTGGDLIRTLGLPKDEDLAVERLRSGRTLRVDLGRVRFVSHEGERALRHFINIGDIGLGGDTVARVNRTTKAFGGRVSFLWGTLATVVGYRNKDIEVVIDGGKPIRGRMCVVVVANGQFFGGGMRIAPQALMNDGLFDIATVGDLGKLELVANIPKIYKGAHVGHPKVKFYRGRHVAVHSRQTALLDLDGEQPGRTDATFEILPGLLDVIV